MKKAVLTGAIAGFTNGGANTAAEFRTYETDVTENTYATIRNEDSASPIWTTPVDATDRPYWFQIVKQGRNYVASGWIRNLEATTMPAGTSWCEIKPTVAGNPSDLIPDNSTDPFTGSAVWFRFIGRTPLGSEVEFAIGYRSATSKYELFAVGDVAPNSSSVSRYHFSREIIVKD